MRDIILIIIITFILAFLYDSIVNVARVKPHEEGMQGHAIYYDPEKDVSFYTDTSIYQGR